jgi:hypothetical protein
MVSSMSQTDMVLEWLQRAALVVAAEKQGQCSHEDVVEALLGAALMSFDARPSRYVMALNDRVTGLGTALKQHPSMLRDIPPATCVLDLTEWERVLTILSWLRFVDGNRVGLKRQTLAGHLRGYPDDALRRILSPDEKITRRAVQQMCRRALASIVDGVCVAYGFELVGSCDFAASAPQLMQVGT